MLWIVKTIQIIKVNLKNYLDVLLPPFLGTVVMCVVISLLKALIDNHISFILVVITALIVGGAVYFWQQTLVTQKVNKTKNELR